MKACSLLWGRGEGGGGGGGMREEEEEGKEGVTVQQYNDLHTHLRLPPFSLSHTRSCVIQRLPAISTDAYGPNEIQCQMGASPIGFPLLKDVRLGTT